MKIDELVEELKQKAKGKPIAIIGDRLIFEGKAEWVRLDDVVDCLNKLKQNYVILPKSKIGEFLEIIASDVHPLKLKKFVEELLRENEGSER